MRQCDHCRKSYESPHPALCFTCTEDRKSGAHLLEHLDYIDTMRGGYDGMGKAWAIDETLKAIRGLIELLRERKILGIALLLALFVGCRSAEVRVSHKPSGLRVVLRATGDSLTPDKLVVR